MKQKALDIAKLCLVAVVEGIFVGGVVSVFALALFWCNETRSENGWLIYLLPFGGLVIAGIHKLAKVDDPKGTNRVIARIHENKYVKTIMAPLIFASTLISQLFGASVGREAAALQIGGALGSATGKLLKVDEGHSSVIVTSGMAAAFSALFGTPVAAALFALEIADGRIKNMVAIAPCLVSSFIAYALGTVLKVPYLNVKIASEVAISTENFLCVLLLSLFSALACVLFVLSSKWIKIVMKKTFKNPFVRVAVTGIVVILMTLICGCQTFNGVGSDTIHACLTDPSFQIVWFSPLLKILFTNVSLGGGYQGGEIVPVLFVGATLGNAFSQYFALDATFCAAIGMIGLFSASTKCPLASIAIAFELFGFNNPVYFLITVVFSTALSGPFRIYEEQKLFYMNTN